MPPLGFSTPPQIPNIITSERLPMNTTVFAATTPENTPYVYRASTSANPNPMISHAFVEANYEVLKSLLRERRRQIRNEDLRSGLEYFNEDYDGEREMKPRPEPNREATPTLRLREGRREGRNTEGSRPSETKTRENGNKGVNLPPLLAVHLGRNESAFSPHQRSNNLVIPSSLYTPTGLMPIHVNPYSQPSTGIVNGQPLNFPFQTQIGNPLAGGISAYHSQGGRTSMQEMESWEKEWNEEGSQKTPPKKQKGVFSYAVAEEKVVVNDKYLEQTITFEKQISKHFKGSKKRRGLGRGEQQYHCCKEVEELTKVGILRKVKHQTWVANPVMVKKSDRGWRMCVDFTYINKACPKECYPLPEIGWKVESLLGFRLKFFLDAYKGYHQIQMAEGDEDKMASISPPSQERVLM
ncbi:hypothetical protein Tco_1440440 [Tanacetum coccineum]